MTDKQAVGTKVPVPLLTKEDAARYTPTKPEVLRAFPGLLPERGDLCGGPWRSRVQAYDDFSTFRDKMNAIASGDAVVIPRITREALANALSEACGGARYVFFTPTNIIAALKRLGINVTEK